MLIDTAGVRRRGRVASGPDAERFSTLRALRAVSRADVAILVIDAVEGLTAQDAHIAGYVVEEGKGLLVVVNKWDLLAEKTDRTFDQYVDWIRQRGAVPRLRAGDLDLREDRPAGRPRARSGDRHLGRAPQARLDGRAEPAGDRTPRSARRAPVVKGRRPKLFYATQVAVAPPTFVFFAREAGSVHFSYRRYLENRLREAFGFDGTPIRLVFRERSSVQLAKRRRDQGGGGRRRRLGVERTRAGGRADRRVGRKTEARRQKVRDAS